MLEFEAALQLSEFWGGWRSEADDNTVFEE